MYKYSSQKLLQHLEKIGLESLELVRDKSSTKKLQEQLDKIIRFLKRVFEILDASPNELPEGVDLGKFCLGLDVIDTFIRKLFDDDDCIKELDFLDITFKKQAAPCLKKVTSITSSINILLTYASDPRLRSRFLLGKRLEIECTSPSCASPL
ncbi:hypothetical protein SI65_02338 [Aspergillus cristatus]|uniref:Uncharacterized protein n=1 Tax=Aspergillus cristatus TaxID=573508 RepID=A0A1E3BKL5_ASPCR|nr:hypothetical protein SI65_02338 [Aspergillus cristatus]